MELNDYQVKALGTFGNFSDPLAYLALGLNGEAGEVADKVKRHYRGDALLAEEENLEALIFELGDVLWYLSALSHVLGYSLEEVAQMNIDKLTDRALRGTIQGEGDVR